MSRLSLEQESLATALVAMARLQGSGGASNTLKSQIGDVIETTIGENLDMVVGIMAVALHEDASE